MKTYELSTKLIARLFIHFNKELKKIEEKVKWYDKLQKWEIEYSDSIRFKDVILYSWHEETTLIIFLNNKNPSIKAMHLIIDQFIHDFNIEPEELNVSQAHKKLSFNYKGIVEIQITLSDHCSPVYRKYKKLIEKVIGYECYKEGN